MSGGNISGEISPGENVQIPLSYEPGKTNERQTVYNAQCDLLVEDCIMIMFQQYHSALTEKSAKFT